ncbi:MAG TPA: hypothetical protein VGK63_05930, partial [Candidatus Limnocylindrales bacterium]
DPKPTFDQPLDLNLTDDLIVSPFADPSPPEQSGAPDTIADAVDFRPTDAVWRNGRLLVASTNTCTPDGDDTVRDCARFTELTTNGKSDPPDLRQDVLIGQDGYDSFMPGVGYAGDGTIHVAWTRSSSTSFADSMASYQGTSDDVSTIAAPTVVAAGQANYDGSRWGDYVGVAQDPQVPNAVWEANEYAATDNSWSTKVAQLETSGLRYVPISPVRVLDSRNGTGLSGKFQANTARAWNVAGVGSIDDNARAVTGNITIVNQQAKGHVSVTPTPTNSPTTSTLNFPTGESRANNLTATLSSSGTLAAVYVAGSGKTADVIFDVTGYYVDDDTAATYTSEEPVRVLDTRIGTGLGGVFNANVARRLVLGGVDFGGTTAVPADATAITGNLTATGATAKGHISITDSDPGSSEPPVSNLNFPAGDNRANGVTVTLDDPDTDGHTGIWLVYRSTSGAKTHVILDVTGYFTNDDSGAEFHPLNPGRILDTRSGAVLSGLTGVFSANHHRTLDVDGHWGVPAGATAITGNLTVVNQTNTGHISVTQDPNDSPTTSTLNAPLGDTRANGITAPLSTSPAGNVSATWANTGSTHLILDLSGYFE